MDTYVLYKNPIQTDTLAIVQYLNSLGIKLLPAYCIELNHSSWVVELPSIEVFGGRRYIGLRECIGFYESVSGERNLLKKALEFKEKNPGYKIVS